MDKAKSAIILILRDKLLRHVSKLKTTTEIWSKLEGLCITKSLVNHLYLKQSFHSFKMQEDITVESHLDVFNKLNLDLENIKLTFIMKIIPRFYCVRKHEVYSLEREEVFESVASSFVRDMSIIELWYKRLAHASEMGLVELCK